MKKFNAIYKYDLKKEYISEHLNKAMNVDNQKLGIAEICVNRHRKKCIVQHKVKKKMLETKSLSFYQMSDNDFEDCLEECLEECMEYSDSFSKSE